MLLYLIRHGESEANRKGLYQGPNMPLSEEGIKQAHALAERLKNHNINIIYSSPMLRAKQTAEIISGKLKISVEYWESLREIRTPSEIWGKSAKDEEGIKIGELIKNKFLDGEGRYSDEETFEELNKRAIKVLEHLLSHHEDQNVLCVSHGTMIKTIVSKFIFGENLTAKMLQDIREHLRIKNTGITLCEHTDSWGWTLINWNDVTHL